MSENHKSKLKDEACSYAGFTSSNNFYDFIYQHRDRADLWDAAAVLIQRSGPALSYVRANFVLSCATDPDVKKRAAVKMATSRSQPPSPSGRD